MKGLAILLCLAACTPRQPKPATLPLGPIAITVAHDMGADAWTITYHLPERVRALGFQRGDYAYRVSNWKLVQPADAVLRHDVDGDHIVGASAFDTVVIHIPSYFKRIEKDYELFFRYTDGATSVYTGDFDVAPVTCVDAACTKLGPTPAPVATELTFVPRESEWVVTPLGRAQGSAKWRSDGDTTYICFGTAAPMEWGGAMVVVDPGFPEWLRMHLLRITPEIIDYYSAKTGENLPWRPRIFLSYSDGAEPKGISITGGTQASLVQFAIALGSDERSLDNPDVRDTATFLMAHELAHLWNAQAFSNDGGDWLHEGGADAFAFRAIRDLRSMTLPRYQEASYKDTLSLQLSLCLLNSQGLALKASSVPGKFKNYYWCGSTLELWAEAALRQHRADLTLFDFWKEVFAEAPKRHYDMHTFFAAMRHFQLDEWIPPMTRAVDEVVSEEWLVDQLRGAGVTLSSRAFPDDLPRDYQAQAAVLTFKAVAPLVPKDFALSAIDGLTKKQGTKLYDIVAKKCAAHESILLSSATTSTTVPCTITLAPRPHYYDVH